VKAAASPKSSKTDGRALLANSGGLRQAAADDKAADKAATSAADAAADVDRAATDSSNDAAAATAVVASGFAVVADYTDKVGANDFFTPGRIFAARVKHSSFPGN